MKRAIAIGLGIALGTGAVHAQPAPAPAPGPGGTPQGAPKPPVTTEKADDKQTLQQGGADRPWAAGVSPEKQTLALRIFQEGNVSLNDGIFPKAVEKYREALRSWDHPAIHYNLALALMNLDQPVEVYDSLQKSVRFGPAPLEKDRYERAREYLLLVEKQLAEIEVSCKKEGAKVSVDGKEVFTVKPGEVGIHKERVRIGKHTFVAEKPGYNARVNAPFIGPGEKFRIELELYTSEELTRYRRRWDRAWVPYAVIGAGVAVGLGGGLMHLSAKSSYDDFDTAIKRCNDDSGGNAGCDVNAPGLKGMRDSGDQKKMIGYIGYGVAGAAVATGLVMVYLNRTTSYQITADEYRRERGEDSVSITPIVAPEMTGAMVHGRF